MHVTDTGFIGLKYTFIQTNIEREANGLYQMWNTAWMKMKPALRIKNWQGWRYKRRSKTVKANVSDNCTLQKNKNKKIIKKKIKII